MTSYCENCEKQNNPTNYDLEQERNRINAGFTPNLCSCTKNQLRVAKEINFYISQANFYDSRQIVKL